MKIFRKISAALMLAVAAFFALGDALATPRPLWVAVLFALLALALAVGAWFTWPRRERPWRIEAIIAGR